MSKVLIIEDDDVIAEGMARHLTSAGFDPLWVNKGESGLARLRYERPDVCVLDLMLPGIDGWKLIETARSEGIGTPIVVVSARGTEHDRVHALEIGADDYLVKPFSMKELVARVRAAARRGIRVQDERLPLRERLPDEAPEVPRSRVDGQRARVGDVTLEEEPAGRVDRGDPLLRVFRDIDAEPIRIQDDPVMAPDAFRVVETGKQELFGAVLS